LSETKHYIVRKLAEPEDLGEAYASSLEEIPGEETDLTPDLPIILKRREMTEEVAEEVASRGHVLSVEEDGVARKIPIEEARGASLAAENMSPEDIRRHLGADKVDARGTGIRVAVLDDGCGPTWAQAHANSIDNKRSYISGETWQSDEDTHGEWCAAAVLLIAPDTKLGIYKVLSGQTGSGSYSGIISGINDAAALGYHGITMSLGGPKSDAVNAAVDAAEAKGVFCCSAAGNEQRGSTAMKADTSSPASAALGTTVAAGRSDSVTSDFSNWGQCVDVKAPGQHVQVPEVAGYWNGTSMSTPLAMGAGSALLGAGASKGEAKRILYASARKTGEAVYKEGHGVADLAAAFAILNPPSEAPEPAPEPPEAPPSDPLAGLPRVGISKYPSNLDREVVVTKNGRDRTHSKPI
jgi:subtilisin